MKLSQLMGGLETVRVGPAVVGQVVVEQQLELFQLRHSQQGVLVIFVELVGEHRMCVSY